MGFIHYEILSRIWVEGTLRIKELNEQMITEIVEAFGAMYPHDSDKCFPQKVVRLYNEMRPVRVLQEVNASATSVPYKISDTVKRHAALFAMQEQATRVLDETNQLLLEPSLETSSPEFAERLAVLSNLHHEFEEWCVKYGSDVVTACNTRNALRRALEQMNEAILLNTQIREGEGEVVEEPVTLRSVRGGVKGLADSIYSKQIHFMRKVSKLVDLHTEYAAQRHHESKQNKRHEGSVPVISRTGMAPIVSTADSVRELEAEIGSAEKNLLSLYEKKRKFNMSVVAPMRNRKAKFLGFFLIPDGKVKHFSFGIDGETGDESVCQLLLAKHGFAPIRKGKRITHYTSK